MCAFLFSVTVFDCNKPGLVTWFVHLQSAVDRSAILIHKCLFCFINHIDTWHLQQVKVERVQSQHHHQSKFVASPVTNELCVFKELNCLRVVEHK